MITDKEKVQKVYDMLYEFLNYTSTGLNLDGNRVHVFIDCFGEFDLIIDTGSIDLQEV